MPKLNATIPKPLADAIAAHQHHHGHDLNRVVSDALWNHVANGRPTSSGLPFADHLRRLRQAIQPPEQAAEELLDGTAWIDMSISDAMELIHFLRLTVRIVGNAKGSDSVTQYTKFADIISASCVRSMVEAGCPPEYAEQAMSVLGQADETPDGSS